MPSIQGCEKKEKPGYLIEEETYIDLLVEFHLARSYVALNDGELTSLDSLNREILDKYGISQEEFSKSHNYYQQQVSRQNDRISKAIELLKKEKVQKDTTDSTAALPG